MLDFISPRTLGIKTHVSFVDDSIIKMIEPGSPTDKAGLRVGDTITKINGTHLFH